MGRGFNVYICIGIMAHHKSLYVNGHKSYACIPPPMGCGLMDIDSNSIQQNLWTILLIRFQWTKLMGCSLMDDSSNQTKLMGCSLMDIDSNLTKLMGYSLN